MNNISNKDKYILLDNLFNLYLDTEYGKEDDDLLKEEKIDVTQIVLKNMMLFRQLRTQTKAELNQQKHNLLKEFIYKLKSGLASNIEEYKIIADEIFAKQKFNEYQTMFRNLSEVSEHDKQSILIDSKLLDLLREIEEDYNKGIK